jgi:hypothetical protein
MRAILLLGLVGAVLAVHLTHEQLKRDGDVIVGGYTALDVNSLSEDAVEVDQYLRKLHTDMVGAKLVAASRQVVAGHNYRFKYQLNQTKGENKTWDIVLYRDLKDNFMENGFTYTVTLPNGQEVKAIGDPASAFLPRVTSAEPVLKKVDSAKKIEEKVSAVVADSKSFTSQPNRSSFPNYIEFIPK